MLSLVRVACNSGEALACFAAYVCFGRGQRYEQLFFSEGSTERGLCLCNNFDTDYKFEPLQYLFCRKSLRTKLNSLLLLDASWHSSDLPIHSAPLYALWCAWLVTCVDSFEQLVGLVRGSQSHRNWWPATSSFFPSFLPCLFLQHRAVCGEGVNLHVAQTARHTSRESITFSSTSIGSCDVATASLVVGKQLPNGHPRVTRARHQPSYPGAVGDGVHVLRVRPQHRQWPRRFPAERSYPGSGVVRRYTHERERTRNSQV